jgi:hypothetical protein
VLARRAVAEAIGKPACSDAIPKRNASRVFEAKIFRSRWSRSHMSQRGNDEVRHCQRSEAI